MSMAMPCNLPISCVLGVDIGWSEFRRSSAACLLSWDDRKITMSLRRFTARQQDVEHALGGIFQGQRVRVAALDGPLCSDLSVIGKYRDAEQILTRGLWRHIGKPGQSSSTNGKKLNAATNAVARLLIRWDAVEEATYDGAILPVAIAEAFPTSFLGVMLENGFKEKGRARSDSYYERLAQKRKAYSLDGLIERLLPGRNFDSDLSSITNHDDRAAIVCALTALCVSEGQYTSVGGTDGHIVLPPRRVGSLLGIQDWAWQIIGENASELPGARLVDCRP